MEHKKNGFTMAELLIVVAIVAVLVAVAVPTFSNQLEKSRQAVDLSNLRAAFAAARIAEMDQCIDSVPIVKTDTVQITDPDSNIVSADLALYWYVPESGTLVPVGESEGKYKNTNLLEAAYPGSQGEARGKVVLADTAALPGLIDYSPEILSATADDGVTQAHGTTEKSVLVAFIKNGNLWELSRIQYAYDKTDASFKVSIANAVASGDFDISDPDTVEFPGG